MGDNDWTMAAQRRADKQAGRTPGAPDSAQPAEVDERVLHAIAEAQGLTDETIEILLSSMKDIDPLDDEQIAHFVERAINRRQ